MTTTSDPAAGAAVPAPVAAVIVDAKALELIQAELEFVGQDIDQVIMLHQRIERRRIRITELLQVIEGRPA